MSAGALFSVLRRAGGAKKRVRAALEAIEEATLLEAGRQYLTLHADLVHQLGSLDELEDRSEDALSDLADELIAEGPDAVVQALSDDRDPDDLETLADEADGWLSAELERAVHDRTGQSLCDLSDDLATLRRPAPGDIVRCEAGGVLARCPRRAD